MRKNWLLGALFAGALPLLTTGCTTQSVYIQDASVQGMMPDIPVHLGEKQEAGAIRISANASAYPQTAFTGRIDSHTFVNDAGVFQIDTTYDNGTPTYHPDNADVNAFKGSNFHAIRPQYSLAADIDLAFAKHASLVGGAQYATLNNNEYDAEYLGLGITSADSVSAIRLDFGWRRTTSRFSLQYVILTTPFDIFTPPPDESTIEIHSATSESKDINFYASLVLNNNHPENFVDYFVRGAIVRQSEFDYAYQANDAFAVEYTSCLISVTPGVVLNISSATRLIAGVVFAHDTNSNDATSLRPMPLAQAVVRF